MVLSLLDQINIAGNTPVQQLERDPQAVLHAFGNVRANVVLAEFYRGNGHELVLPYKLEDGNVRVINGNVAVGKSSASARLDVAGGAIFAGNVLPSTNVLYNLGSPLLSFNNVYSANLFGNGVFLTGLNASNVTTGVLASDRVPFNIANGNIRVINGLVGIGTSQPTEKLHVLGNVSGTYLKGNGALITDLHANNISTGTINNDRLPSNIAINDLVVINSLVGDGSLLTFNSLGIGTQTPAAELHVVGDIIATGEITAFASDERLKTDIRRIDMPLDRLSKIKGVFYNFNELGLRYGLGHDEQVGVLAQDVEQVLPHAVRPAPFDVDPFLGSKTGQSFKTVQYEKLVPLLVEAVLELNAKVEALSRS